VGRAVIRLRDWDASFTLLALWRLRNELRPGSEELLQRSRSPV